jgi:hypothetical protein
VDSPLEDDVSGNGMERSYMVLYEDPAFVAALLSPTLRLLVDYLLGADCVLSSSIATVKRAGEAAFPLHVDGPSDGRDHPLGAAATAAAGGGAIILKAPLRILG